MVVKESLPGILFYLIVFSFSAFSGLHAQIITPEVIVKPTPNGETTISNLNLDTLKSNIIVNSNGSSAPVSPWYCRT